MYVFALCACAETNHLNWRELKHPVYVPFLGRETEFGSKGEADIFAWVLQGAFVAFKFRDMCPPPPGMVWTCTGVFVELVSKTALTRLHCQPVLDDIILQVGYDRMTAPGDRDSCVYVLKREVIKLLHIPKEVFAVLSAHRWHHHCDRHFASHLASFRRARNWFAVRHPWRTVDPP